MKGNFSIPFHKIYGPSSLRKVPLLLWDTEFCIPHCVGTVPTHYCEFSTVHSLTIKIISGI